MNYLNTYQLFDVLAQHLLRTPLGNGGYQDLPSGGGSGDEPESRVKFSLKTKKKKIITLQQSYGGIPVIRVGEKDVILPEGGIHKRNFNPIFTCSITIKPKWEPNPTDIKSYLADPTLAPVKPPKVYTFTFSLSQHNLEPVGDKLHT